MPTPVFQCNRCLECYDNKDSAEMCEEQHDSRGFEVEEVLYKSWSARPECVRLSWIEHTIMGDVAREAWFDLDESTKE